MRSTGQPRYAGDDGAPDRDVAATLSAYAAGRATEQAALAALSRSRLLMPLIEREVTCDDGGACGHSHDGTNEVCGHSDAAGHAAGTLAGHVNEQADEHGGQPADQHGGGQADQHRARQADQHGGQRGDQHGSARGTARGAGERGPTARGAKEMAMPRLIGADGRPAILAFTSLDALVGWRPDARPVPAEASQVWTTAVEDSCAVVIDVAGPVPLVVEGARLTALAAGEPPPAPYADPDVRAQVMAAIADVPGISGAELAEGPPGTDLAVRLLLAAPATNAHDAEAAGAASAAAASAASAAAANAGVPAGIGGVAEAIVAGLASRLRRGLEVSATAAPTAPTAAAPNAPTAAAPTAPAAPTAAAPSAAPAATAASWQK